MSGADTTQDTATPLIRRAYPGEETALTSVVADAFCTLPICQWLIDDDQARPHILLGYFAILMAHVLTHGHTEVIDGTHGPLAVAGWLPPDAPTEPENYPQRVAAATGTWSGRFAALDAELARAHTHDTHHLLFLAVRSDAQNHGLGSALLSHHLGKLDRLRQPASLDAASPRSVPLYTRHRFAGTGTPITVAPHPDQAMIPMRRPPTLTLLRRSRGSRR